MEILIDDILPNPDQPRKMFNAAELEELASSIRQNGLINAIRVEGPHRDPAGNPIYLIVDGERRWRATRLLGKPTIEANVMLPIDSGNPTQRLILALTANLQRSEMSPMEEAKAFQRLRSMGMTITKISHQLGTYQKRVSDRLRLLDLDDEIQDLVNGNMLPTDLRVSESLLSIPDKEARVKTARRLARPGVTIKVIQSACTNVRETLRGATVEAGSAPAVHLGKMRYRKESGKAVPVWDMRRLLGKVPPWGVVQTAALETCDACALREVANDKTCGDCPAVQLIKLMLVGIEQ